MTLEVLQKESQIGAARKQLERRGLSFVEGKVTASLLRLLRPDRLALGDRIKSWDVNRTFEFLSEKLSASDRVLDIGCYASEILPILHRAGFTRLTGIDLNDRVGGMPYADRITYEIGNFMATPFPDAHFDAITAVSVIEHGYVRDGLVSEVARLTRPGGYFVASFDYWPDKIDTTGVEFFDQTWTIFSRDDVQDLVRAAHGVGFEPVGELCFDADERTIDCGGKQYTFGWIALRKTG